MIRTLIVCLVGVSFATMIAAATDEPYRPVPMIKAVDPDSVKAGEQLTATGTHLAKASVASLYMIQGEKTIQVSVQSQTEEAIQFKVPADVTKGRFQFMILTTGANPQYLEEPVYFTVEQ